MKLSVAASCLLSLPIPTAMASTAKATKAKASPHTANASTNKIVHSEYFLGPVSCPKHCVSGATFGDILAAENVQQCNPDDKYQRWLIHQVNDGGGEVIKAESPENAGRCLGVASHGGGDDMLGSASARWELDPLFYLDSAPSPNEDTCNGQLALVDCQHPTANWLLSGAQLYSAVGSKESAGEVLSFGTIIRAYVEPLQSTFEYHNEGFAAAMASGDIMQAGLFRLLRRLRLCWIESQDTIADAEDGDDDSFNGGERRRSGGCQWRRKRRRKRRALAAAMGERKVCPKMAVQDVKSARSLKGGEGGVGGVIGIGSLQGTNSPPPVRLPSEDINIKCCI